MTSGRRKGFITFPRRWPRSHWEPRRCPPFQRRPPIRPASGKQSVQKHVTASQAELLAYRVGNGDLYWQRFDGESQWVETEIGKGWSTWKNILFPGDVTRDGIPDLVGIDKDGRIWTYPAAATAPSALVSAVAVAGAR
ncbi:hypothetical protein NKH18_34950 [Streptomyces sp. M10(2022)]